MSGHALWNQFAAPTLFGVLLFVSVLGLVLGLGLMLRSAGALSLMAFMNRWISTRPALRLLDAPVRLSPALTGKRWFGMLLVALGAFAAAMLLSQFDVSRLAALLKLERYSLGSIGLEALKWLLVVGALTAVAAGAMLLFIPRAWRALEERANRWYSTAELEVVADRTFTPLERLAEVQPRAMGGIIFALSLAAAATSGLLLFPGR